MKDLNVVVYLDDLLVMGRDETEHLMNLDKVLQRLQENGLRVKKAKCDFGKTQIEYLGHMLDGKGVYPSKDKVRAVHDAPTPTNIKELRAFLGLLLSFFATAKYCFGTPLQTAEGPNKMGWIKVEQNAFDAKKCWPMTRCWFTMIRTCHFLSHVTLQRMELGLLFNTQHLMDKNIQ